ncbi:hypothetical protein [Streptomyces luteireticuli]|uniref:hypothetical protein n=1 Tax=Streptomyces luteireticuli TaxID=173858 RepID=UPI0031E3ECA9
MPRSVSVAELLQELVGVLGGAQPFQYVGKNLGHLVLVYAISTGQFGKRDTAQRG